MRLLLAFALVLPLLVAGCADDEPGPRVEAFTAAYDVPATTGLPAYTATVTFGKVVDFIEANGEVRQGYALDVDYGDATERLCGGQSILDERFDLHRYRWGNGWNGDGRCTNEQVDWTIPGAPWPRVPHFGVAWGRGQATVEADESLYVYDDHLAPVRIERGGAVIATRTSYESNGPLPPLALSSETLQLLPQLPGTGPSGLAGGDKALSNGMVLDDALAYLASNDADAAAMLDGGCLSMLSFWVPSYHIVPLGAGPVIAQDEEQATLHVDLVKDGTSAGFSITYGRKAPMGEPGFLSTAKEDALLGHKMDCARRGLTAPLDAQEALVQALVPGGARNVYAIWQQANATADPWFQWVADTEDGRISIHGSAGRLESWNLAKGHAIDP